MQDMDANALNQTLLSYMEKQKSAQFARMPLQTEGSVKGRAGLHL